jgi:hypothetical protein
VTTLHLVTDADRRAGSTPSRRRPSRSGPHLKLVADTGAAYRSSASNAAPPRRHSVLTLGVAAAAIVAAFLTTTAFQGDRESSAPVVAVSIPALP